MAARDYIVNNFWWKLLSLALAGLTWLTIRTAFEKDQTLRETPVITESKRNFPSIPVTLLTSPSNPGMYHVEPATVAIELAGTLAALSKLQERDIHAFVDISDAGDEKRLRKPIQIRIPDNMEVTHLVPSYANIDRIPAIK